jgi:hypothetical protein
MIFIKSEETFGTTIFKYINIKNKNIYIFCSSYYDEVLCRYFYNINVSYPFIEALKDGMSVKIYAMYDSHSHAEEAVRYIILKDLGGKIIDKEMLVYI